MTRSGNLVPGDGRRRNMRVVFAGLIAAVVAVVAGCAAGPGAGEPGSGASSGVEGVTVVDEGCPIQHGTAPCPERPLRARIVVVRQGSSDVVARTESDGAGRFRVPLRPGRYLLRPENLTGAPVPWARPVDVEVRAGAFSNLTVPFDSGVRGPAQ